MLKGQTCKSWYEIIVGIKDSSFLISCNKDKEILNTLNDYNISMESKGYHFGDALNLPNEVTTNAESISISFGDKETSSLVVDPKFFTLGDNAVTFIIKKKGGETLNQDATINVFAKNPEALLKYEIDDMRLLYENDVRFLKQF